MALNRRAQSACVVQRNSRNKSQTSRAKSAKPLRPFWGDVPCKTKLEINTERLAPEGATSGAHVTSTSDVTHVDAPDVCDVVTRIRNESIRRRSAVRTLSRLDFVHLQSFCLRAGCAQLPAVILVGTRTRTRGYSFLPRNVCRSC